MKSLLLPVKKLVLWGYGRTTWQYDVLSAVILAFIFLTPPRWFATGKQTPGLSHQNSSKAATLLLPWPAELPANPRTDEVERRARQLTGRPSLRVTGFRRAAAGDAEPIFEVDIE
jgi:hypothetical protein